MVTTIDQCSAPSPPITDGLTHICSSTSLPTFCAIFNIKLNKPLSVQLPKTHRCTHCNNFPSKMFQSDLNIVMFSASASCLTLHSLTGGPLLTDRLASLKCSIHSTTLFEQIRKESTEIFTQMSQLWYKVLLLVVKSIKGPSPVLELLEEISSSECTVRHSYQLCHPVSPSEPCLATPVKTLWGG